jgi:pyruvate formate lyase activating enzyme
MEIKGFIETSLVDWRGYICGVLFLPGCNFRCPFCHNHPLLLRPQDFPTLNLETILFRLKRFTGWVEGVTISGGEPTLQRDLPELAGRLKAEGLKVKVDTNGSRPEVIRSLYRQGRLDFVSMDFKAPLNPQRYPLFAGAPVKLKDIARTLTMITSGQIPGDLRTTVVPGFHTDEDLREMTGQVQGFPHWIRQDFDPTDPLDPSLRQDRRPVPQSEIIH